MEETERFNKKIMTEKLREVEGRKEKKKAVKVYNYTYSESLQSKYMIKRDREKK